MKRKAGEVVAAGADEDPHYASTWDAITKIVQTDGLSGLYAGMNGSLLGVASTNFAYFYWYSVVRALYVRSAKSTAPPSTLVELSLGAVAGAVAQLCTIPVAVITTRQQTQKREARKGMLDTAREVIDSEDGVFGLWRGLKASLVLVINPAITYGAYERLRQAMYPGKKNLRPAEAFRMSNRDLQDFSLHEANELGFHSPRCHVQGSGDHCHTAADCRQGRPAVQASRVKAREAVQGLRRGDEVHRRKRGSSGAIQGHWSADP